MGGAPPGVIVRLVLLAVPAIMVKTFSMSMLLAGLLGFGRLSSDSELVALRAGGASVPRILRPVAVVSLLVAFATFAFNEMVVPRAARTAATMMADLLRHGQFGGKGEGAAHRPEGPDRRHARRDQGRCGDGRAPARHRRLAGCAGEPHLASRRATRPTTAPRTTGASRAEPASSPSAIHARSSTSRATPGPRTSLVPSAPLEDLLDQKDDYDAYSLAGLRDKIAQMKRDGNKEARQVNDYEYGYYNKFSVALAALVFGVLGAVLGIRNHRTGTASGFALAVGIIFGYIALANFMNEWAKGGLLPPWAASFAPLCIGAAACGVIIYRRNL